MTNRNGILAAAAAVVAVGVAWFIVSSWGDRAEQPAGGDTATEARGNTGHGEGAAADRAASEQGGTSSLGPNWRRAREESPGKVEAALANAAVHELIEEEEAAMPDDEEEAVRERNRRLIGIITRPMDDIFATVPSFRCEGRMTVSLPTLVQSEEEFNQGKFFGKNIEVTSRFTLEKDSKGNFHLQQETRSATGDTKFDGPEYNGQLTCRDGKYTFVAADGTSKEGDDLNALLSGRQAELREPLLRANLKRLLGEHLPQVIDFEESAATAAHTTYEIVGANPTLQDKTIKLDTLEGSATLNHEFEIAEKQVLSGKGTMRTGYLAGANIAFEISQQFSEINQVSDLGR